jgi:hypothetical protein
VVERGPRILGDEIKELFPPWILDKWEESFPELLQLLDTDCANGSCNGFAPGFRDFLHVYCVEWHDVGLAVFAGK